MAGKSAGGYLGGVIAIGVVLHELHDVIAAFAWLGDICWCRDRRAGIR